MQLYLAAAPCCLGNAARWGLPLLYAAYGVEESRLTSLTLPAHVQGGLLLPVSYTHLTLPTIA